MRLTSICAPVLLIALLAGCAGTRAGGPRTPRPTGTLNGMYRARGVEPRDAVVWITRLPTAKPGNPRRVRDHSVMILTRHDIEPHVLAVERGTLVDFHNRDSLYHNAFSVSPSNRFDAGRCPPGQWRRVSFKRSGVVNVYCALDSRIAGWIVVVPTRHFTQPDEAGRFTFTGLRRGRYLLHYWDPIYGERRRRVRLPAPADANVTLGN